MAGPPPRHESPYPPRRVPDRNGVQPPRWWRTWWPIVTSAAMFFAGLYLGYVEVTRLGARPQVLVLVIGLLLGPSALTTALSFFRR